MKMKTLQVMLLVLASVPGVACANNGKDSGSESAPVGAGSMKKANSCTTARDCHGMLPHLCQQCPDGASVCAHFACEENTCRVQTCEGHQKH